jgi:membrane carboxypeptidase/penicillin-binding protein
MPSIPHILRMRQRRRVIEKNATLSRSGLGCATLISIAVALTGILLTLLYTNLTHDLPSLERIPLLIEPPNGLLLQPTEFYDRSGEFLLYSLQNPAVDERQYIPIANNALSETLEEQGEYLPAALISATVAVMDPGFWSHPGFSFKGIMQGTQTTIAQHVVSDLLFWNETPGIRRSLRERLLAAQITKAYDRSKVIEWYLNSAYFGNLAYGIDSAAQVYLGKSADQLNLVEAALLTAVAQKPALNPLDAPQTALERGEDALQTMLRLGLISVEEARQAENISIKLQKPVGPKFNPAPEFSALVLAHLVNEIELERLERGGFKIITTLDIDLQLQASCTTKIHLARVTGQSPPQQTPGEDNCPAALLLAPLSLPENLSTVDIGLNLAILEPHTGQILALVGSPSTGIKPAHAAGYAPGSMLTPFVYLTAFTRGFSPASLAWDIGTALPENIATRVNPEGVYHGPVRLRTALANDYLTPAIEIMSQIGPESVWRTIRQFGLSSLAIPETDPEFSGCRGCQLLLTGGQVTLLEMIQAFGTLANEGVLVGELLDETTETGLQSIHPVTIISATDREGQHWIAERDPEKRPVTNPQLAYLMTHVLSDEAARWPSLGHPNPLEIGRPAAVKIGVNDDQSSTWVIGYTPQVVVGVWAGTLEETPTQNIPPNVAATLWNAITRYTTRYMASEVWSVPPGISTVDVCDPSGMYPTRYCPTVVSEVFLQGNEPTQPDNLYQAFKVNRETGLLATIFTPPELVDERVYLVVPPEANAWAEEAGLSKPPESYDVIYSPPTSPDAQINSPAMYAHVTGDVPLRGTASGDDLISYRLQVGQGLNPQTWLQITEDITETVQNALLGTWNTESLSGLFAIQLVVLRENQRVDTATVQVTVDNQYPELSIPYPSPGQTFTYELGSSITFQAQASDNIALDTVEFYLGERLVASQTQPPYAIPWRTSPGEFTLRVVATDLAGNQSQAEVNFQVKR